MATSQKFILSTDERGSVTEELPFVTASQSYTRFLTANTEVALTVPSWAKKFKLTVSSGAFVYVGQGNSPIVLPSQGDNSWLVQSCEANPILRGLKDGANRAIQVLRFISPSDAQINVILYRDDTTSN